MLIVVDEHCINKQDETEGIMALPKQPSCRNFAHFGNPLLVWRHIFMNHCSRFTLTLGLVASFVLGMNPFSNVAQGAALSPGVSTLSAITAEVGTPVRLATDSSGNIYVTDPSAAGILMYDRTGGFVKKIVTPKSGSGVAIAQNGELLVTQSTYVAVINPATGQQRTTFGPFTYANGIAVGTVGASAGKVYVTDGRSNKVYRYGPDPQNSAEYVLELTSPITLNRPAGIASDKTPAPTGTGLLYIANSLSGNVQVVNPDTLTLNSTIGSFGYTASPVVGSTARFTYPQGVALEYDQAGVLNRVYVSDSVQGTVQVLDGTVPTRTWLANVGGYGYTDGKLFTPSDVLIDQFSATNKRIFVANGGGNVAVFGCDNMQPINMLVTNPTLNSLTLAWVNPTTPGFSKVRIYRSDASGQPLSLLADNQTGTSFTDNGLSQGTNYYYLVRAVDDLNVEYSNTQPVSGKTRINYSLNLTTQGSGSISGDATCGENTSSSSSILDNSVVTLTALPNAYTSVFTGWTGACAAFGDNENCQITMDTAKSAVASFEAQWPFHVDGWLLETLQDAHNTAEGSGSVIEVMTGTWPASTFNMMTADRPITIKVTGGLDSGFTSVIGTTTIQGRVNVKAGKIIANGFKIKP